MAKQFIISAMEEVLGEYILNISKDNLKIAAVRGQIKLENVQLDGDLIGSHVLGAVGLSSFGVLSCSAKSIKVSIPWKNLEKEPTRFEIKGVHLVCVPLTPSTASQMYGAGTAVDPRCTLRTRAKRLVLARLERNFWNGQIPGEGPVMKRIQRAVKDVERDMKRSVNKQRKRGPMSNRGFTVNAEDAEMEDLLDNLVYTLGDSLHNSLDRSSEQDDSSSFYSASDLPQIPRDWKVRLREKVLRNIVASFHELHIRLEVPERGLELSGTDGAHNTPRRSGENTIAPDRAFALGFTLESLVIRTANEKWEAGSHEKRTYLGGSTMSAVKDHLGPNEYVAFNNKIGYFNKLSIYWDDSPPILLSETVALQGNNCKLSTDKLHSRVTAAMEALFMSQDPGPVIRQSLSAKTSSESHVGRPHSFICESLDAEVRVRTSDRTLLGPISCSADVLPFSFTFNVRPNQYLQYQRLKSAVKSQHRFDTMLRQRPFESPKENPRAWWKYAIACVTSRPNSRPWQDVKKIGMGRRRYIELVAKKNTDKSAGVGFHAGLSSKQSDELLAMEDSLPLEALLAFHLVALRRVHESQQRKSAPRQSSSDVTVGVSSLNIKGKSSGRFRILRSSGSLSTKNSQGSFLDPNKNAPLASELGAQRTPSHDVADVRTAASTLSLLEAMTIRLGKKIWFVDWKLHDALVSTVFRRALDDTPMLQFDLRASGSLKSFGLGKRDFSFAVTQCDVLHGVDKILFFASSEGEGLAEEESDEQSEHDETSGFDSTLSVPFLGGVRRLAGPDLLTPSSFLKLPPRGTVCRIAAGKNQDIVKLSISAHPATLVWTTSLSDGISEFFVDQSTELQMDWTQHLRTAATPLARKAQLALLSPASLALHLNIAAPKVWVPLVSNNTEGSLFLDAGTLRMSSSKDEGETEVHWTIQARDIGANFVRGFNSLRFCNESHLHLRSYGMAPIARAETAVVRPFSIVASSQILRNFNAGENNTFTDPIRNTEVVISPICLNLVDAEMLARLLGKLYARGLHRVRRQVLSTDRTGDKRMSGPFSNDNFQLAVENFKPSELPRVLSVKIEKVEMALEGHSKQLHGSDERSLASLDTALQEYAPPTRAYLVEIDSISLKKSHLGHTEITRLFVTDASIMRLRDVSVYTPLKVRRENIESENFILVRASDRSTENGSPLSEIDEHDVEAHSRGEVFSASLLRNGISHLDEVEVAIDSVVLRVTPTTLKDCAKAFRRIMELAQLVTKEMERKVHEEGRKARRRARDGDGSQVGSVTASLLDRPVSPAFSETMTDITALEKKLPSATFDSSILFRVTLNESTVLAGRPTTMVQSAQPGNRSPSFAVVQVLSNALIMFQSIENPDATGTKTLHISVDNLSALVNTKFERVTSAQAPTIMEPTGAEFRVVYSTENFGCVVSQDVSLDCDSVKSCLTPNDMSILINISRTMFERLRAFGIQQGLENNDGKRNVFSSLVRYQKKGTGIATRVRAEIQTLSFVLLKAYKSHFGSPEFLDFNVKHVKGLFEGCMSALSGECSALVAVNFFNSEVSDWEYAVEPFPLALGAEQMPNELVFNIAPAYPVQLNLTGILLRDFAQMQFDISRDRPRGDTSDTAVLTPSALSTVGLRRATEARSVTVQNLTGFDIHVVRSTAAFTPESGLVTSGSSTQLDSATGAFQDNEITLSLRISSSAVDVVGERQPVLALPVASSLNQARLCLLKPATTLSSLQPGRSELLRLLDGRLSPESMLSDVLAMDSAYYDAEPVVEWCMQNQRLRSNVVDVFSIQKGRDLLSSNVWSPEDDFDEEETKAVYEHFGRETPVETDGPEAAAGAMKRRSVSHGRVVTTGIAPTRSNWLHPYLKNDAPEWSDMTCMLSMARERVMLPDSRWIWLNYWTVDVNGRLGEESDTDGWSYEADFETFSKVKRRYQRGDACRRRRWTRARMIKPPTFDDPFRQLKFVWETSRDENGCFFVNVRSHVRIKNETATALTFFVYAPSWDEDKLVGTAKAGEYVHVPVACASAAYMRIAKNAGIQEPASLFDYVFSDRFLIVPTSHTSSSYIRTSMDFEDVSGTTLHFVIELRSEKGILNIVVEPVIRLVNLLPCQLECQVGQVFRSPGARPENESLSRQNGFKRVTKTEALTIQSGKEGACIAVNVWRKPHLSLRVPGYRWSSWKQIVNRKADDCTWRPSEIEEGWHFASKGDTEYAEELMTLVRFERLGKIGDPLILILSVACGHCPTIRVYSQYLIVDKTGFGCRFSEGFTDLLGTIPDPETSRRSYLLKEEGKDVLIVADMSIPGHQWSIGSSGMSLYFSHREKLALSIERSDCESGCPSRRWKSLKSKWISPLDISNVIPKTVFSVDELNGPRRFELAIHVTLCSGLFARTKMISLLPRYQIVNLLHRELAIAQDGCLETETIIPSQSSIPFHWEKGSMPPKVRLGAPSADERARGNYERCWTNGRFQLDRIGITSLRLPTTNTLVKVPMVVQAEVRLATKDQPSAVVVVVWSGSDKSNPLYTLRNCTRHTILCRQPLQDEENKLTSLDGGVSSVETCSEGRSGRSLFECGADIGPIIRTFLGLERIEEFVWILKPHDVTCFGFDDPEKPHILEWTYVSSKKSHFDKRLKKAFLEVDAMGSFSVLTLPGGPQVRCQLRAEHSTKVIEFIEIGVSGRPNEPPVASFDALRQHGLHFQEMLEYDGRVENDKNSSLEEDETITFSLRIDIPVLSISVVDNVDPKRHGREILLAQFEKIFLNFSQTREGYHEFEMRLMTFQVDNHVQKSIHPVLIFCPRIDDGEPLLHMSAVRRVQPNSNTFVFRYAAIRLLEVEIYLDRRTAETIARFIQPLMILREEVSAESPDWVDLLTTNMEQSFAKADRRTPRDLEKMIHMANSGRIYFEQLHLHPVRLGLTFTQEWIDMNGGSDTVMIFQFIRGMASIANAPLVFTSFVVGHVFESPQALFRVIATHYSSQLTKQVFGILGSLAILGAPADFISNVGTGVRDFFYEPIQGAVHGPRQFIEGLEAGTESLARGVFVGVVRGAANVTDAVNSNLAGLTADDDFIDERKAHQRMLTDAMSRGAISRTFRDSLSLAYASIARGLKSGALGIVEQPAIYASKHGPVGFLKGVGKAMVGAVVKPVVGLGDGAVLVMNHMSDATSKKQVFPKIPKRLRRALPSRSADNRNGVFLESYDERAAKAQKIVTGGESVEDVYLGHVNIASHLIIASEQCLWAIDRRSREPWCVSWEEISHFGTMEGGVRIVVFSQTGLKTYVFQVENPRSVAKFHQLLSMQRRKMANVSELNNSLLSSEPESLSRQRIPGVRSRQVNHKFGSCNNSRKRSGAVLNDEVDLVEQCHNRVRRTDSSSSTFFKSLDEEAWSLVSSWGFLFSGLSSRRCLVASIINGTGNPIQIKSTKLVEGGSPCYSLATREYDTEQGILHAGGAIIFFGWGVVPNLMQAGRVFMHIESNGFVSDLADQKGSATNAIALPGYNVGFLEKSYDDSGWWAKYWLLVRSEV